MKTFMKTKIFLLSFVLFSVTLIANAQGLTESKILDIIQTYRFQTDVQETLINVPTVVEVPFTGINMERVNFAILDQTTNTFEPYYLIQETLTNEIPIVVRATAVNGDSRSNLMNDDDLWTYTDFILPENILGQTEIVVESAKAITSSSLTLLLDKNITLPNFIEITARVNGQDKVLVAKKSLNQLTIDFPKTTSTYWSIKLFFGQPLRISELRLHQENATQTKGRAIRFLAQPSHNYRLYFDPDRLINPPVGESGNLKSANNIIVNSVPVIIPNLDYIISDLDKDTIPDIFDNCISVFNPDQEDVNKNGRGDICDDFDQDGVINNIDNCQNYPNRDQKDNDGDGIGDVCDDEESRITERLSWLPWAGIGLTAIIVISLGVLIMKSEKIKTVKKVKEEVGDDEGEIEESKEVQSNSKVPKPDDSLQ